MRSLAALLAFAFGLHATAASAQTAPCVGLACQQVPAGSCPAGGPATTTLTGTVYAPNGVDPLPNVLVYIPNASVDPFVPGIACPVVGQPPSGSPLVGATTGVDGTFSIDNVPVGTNIPLVIISGRWRRQIVIPSISACAATAADSSMTRFPRNQNEGDIPKFAIATGSADSVECVLRKVGIDDAEFTDFTGTGRINLFAGSGSPGATIGSAPNQSVLMGTAATLNSYDVLMLPCEGSTYPNAKSAAEYTNLVGFANAGGRVYSSHFSYQWMEQANTFASVANWLNSSTAVGDGLLATVDTSFSASQTLASWLTLVGAGTGTPPNVQISLSAVKHDINGVNSPTESWLRLNQAVGSDAHPVMQAVWDTPVGAIGAQCGRVLFNEYHVENPVITSTGKTFPNECSPGSTLNPQEKLLEYSLFELTNNGSGATLAPLTQDFGSIPVGFNSPVQNFTFTNNSSFTATVNLLTTTGDFTVTANNCASVKGNSTCTISVIFTPTALGARTGTLSVGSSGTTLSAALTGTGIPVFSISPASLTYGSFDVGASSTQTVTVTNTATGAVPVPGFITSGDYAVKSNCPTSLAAGSACTLQVTFTPTTTGTRTGTLTPNSTNAAYANISAALTGTGIDFTIVANPTSGKVIAGYNVSLNTVATPIAGFNSPIALTCVSTVPGSTCTVQAGSFGLGNPVTTPVTITTTSKYTVIGFTGGATGTLALISLATGVLLWLTRRRTSNSLRFGFVLLVFGLASLTLTGCTSKIPAQNAVYTPAGSYTYTISATDGFLIHAATYSLTVTTD